MDWILASCILDDFFLHFWDVVSGIFFVYFCLCGAYWSKDTHNLSFGNIVFNHLKKIIITLLLLMAFECFGNLPNIMVKAELARAKLISVKVGKIDKQPAVGD